jgi:hypothetical protein
MGEADDDPLQAEAARRKDWRGDESAEPDAARSGHTPPASEGGSAHEGSGKSPAPGTLSPPD